MTTEEAIDHLREALRSEDYRIGWQANIAMAFKDHWSLTKKEEGETEGEYIHRLANGAADAFLEQLSPLREIPDHLDGMGAVAFKHGKLK